MSSLPKLGRLISKTKDKKAGGMTEVGEVLFSIREALSSILSTGKKK
jgi:hypothetical protein